MTRQIINIGTGPDSYTGDNLRTAFTKVNDNFAQLYVGNVGANTSINVLTANTVSTNGNVNAGNVLVQYQVIASGNISAPIFIGNGRYLTGVTVSANTGNIAFSNLTISGSVAGNIVLDPAGDGNVSIVSDVIPGANVTYNLGSSTRQWKDLWLSNSTMYLGGFPVTVSNTGALSVNGSPVTSSYGNANVTVFLPTYGGNVGNGSGYLFGNGSQLTGLSATYSNANVADYLPTYTGNIAGNIVKSGYTWTFSNTGTTTFPTGVRLSNARGANTVNFTTDIDKSFQIETQTSTTGRLWSFGTDGNLTLPQFANINFSNGVSILSTVYGNANVASYLPTYTGDFAGNISKNGNVWTFGTNGTTTFPTNISVDYSGNNVQFPRIIADSGKAFSVQGQGNIGSAALAWTVDPNAASQYAAVSVSRAGGDNLAKVVLQAQSDSGDAATAKTWQFNQTGTTRFPGDTILAPAGTSITMQSDQYSQLYWQNANVTVAPNMAINSNFYVAQNNATLDIVYRDGNSTQQQKSWLWGVDGTLTLPTAGRINFDYLSISSDANVSAFYAPAGNVQLAAGTGNAQIVANSLNDSKTWIFGTDGNLTLPGNLVIAGNANLFGTNRALIQPANDLPLIALSSGANGAVSSVWVEDIGNVGTSNIAAVYANPTVGSKIVRIVVGQNGVGGGPNLWDFGTDGNLALPHSGVLLVSGGITAGPTIASPAPYLSGFSSISAISMSASGNITGAYILGNGSQLTGLPATYGNANVATFLAAYGSNTISTTGNITAANFFGNGNTLSNVATRFESSWTVPTGNSTQSFTVAASETYYLWVDCNIPNGILVWNATATVTNTNVPVVGAQYAWVYSGGGTPVDFTSIPNQFVGTANTIVRSNVAPSATTNRFDFGINNTSGGNITVRYGWVAIS